MIDKFCLLCSVGMDYNHGTGHGVGAYLAVHEGPVGVGRDNSVLQENNVASLRRLCLAHLN